MLAAATMLPCLPGAVIAAAAGAGEAVQDASPRGIGRADAAALIAAASADRELYLEVVVNGTARAGLLPFRQVDGELHASAQVLAGLGFDPARLPHDAGEPVRLSQLPGARVEYDVARQRLLLEVDPALLATTHLGRSRTFGEARADTGAVLNYDAYAPIADGDCAALRTFAEARVFGAFGVLSSGWLASIGDDADGLARLDTTWTRTDETRMRSLRIGDIASGALGWTRAVRLGGIQLQRSFASRPDLITFPVPAFAGEAALPSSVDVYVNQVRQFSGEVPGGPFVLDNVPALNGAGEATLVIRDVLGRESTLSMPLYVAPQMLARGLSDYSAELGWLREGYGSDDDGYRGDPVASASLRHGWRDWLTVEAHGEATQGFGMAGAGAQLRLGQLGVVSGSLAGSAGKGSGVQATLGYQYVDPRFSLTLEARRSDAGFRDLASLDGSGIERASDRVLLGLPGGRWGTWSFGYVRSRRDSFIRSCDGGIGGRHDACGRHGSDSRIAMLGWNRTLHGGVSLFGSVVADLDRSDATRVHAGVAFAFGERSHGSIEAGHGEHGSEAGLSLRRSRGLEGGWEWNVDARRLARGDAWRTEARYLGGFGEVDAGLQRHGDTQTAHVGGRGALAWLDGQVFAGRQIHDAFAVVSTDGLAGVPVLHENRVLGRTGRSGHLLVPDLAAWVDNRVAIDPLGMPLDRALPDSEAVVVPRERSGVLVRFTSQRYDGAVARLIDSSGVPLPVGTPAWFEHDAANRFVVGYDGVVFVTGMPADGARLRAGGRGDECVATLPAPPAGAALPDLGAVTCQ